MKNKYIYLAILAAGFVSCEPEFENPVSQDYSAGEANFSSYVAIGNSLTAGYMDGTMYKSGQMNSFPNLLAQQFALVGGGAFTQPSYEDDVNNLGGIAGIPNFGTRLIIDAAQGRPEPLVGSPTISLASQATAYNNMGVPGAKSFHLLAPGYGNAAGLATGQANPYFVRHATSATATVLGDAMTKAPTFFTNWIGNNDILSYATSGGTRPDNPATTTVDESLLPATDQTGNPNAASYGSNDITDPTLFAGVYTQIINTLTSGTNPAKGVVATIPNVTSIPYFTTVPYAPLTALSLGSSLVPLNSSDAVKIAAGTAAMNQLNSSLYNNLDAVFTAFGEANRVNPLDPTKANPILIYDVDAADRSLQISGGLQLQGVPQVQADIIGTAFAKARQATANDLVVLTASSVIGSQNASAVANPVLNGLGAVNNGVSYPMPSKWVLTSTEQAKVTAATTAYNTSIKAIAASKNLAVADMNAILTQLVSGLKADNGTIYTANYFGGGPTEFKVLFSLDGVHPNARGYSVIANEVIKVINAHYKAKLPLLNPNNYPGINILATN